MMNTTLHRDYGLKGTIIMVILLHPNKYFKIFTHNIKIKQ